MNRGFLKKTTIRERVVVFFIGEYRQFTKKNFYK